MKLEIFGGKMEKRYGYKCPDCYKTIDFGDKYCKNCSCKLDWDGMENITINETLKVYDNNEINYMKIFDTLKYFFSKQKNIRILNIFILLFCFCMSAYIIGNYAGLYNMSFSEIITYAFIDYVIYSFVFMIYPLILVIKNKDTLSWEKINNLKRNSIIGALFLTLIYSFLTLNKIDFQSVGFFGRMLFFSIFYFHINKWLFVNMMNEGKNSLLSKFILCLLVLLLIILIIFGCISENENKKNIIDFIPYEETFE